MVRTVKDPDIRRSELLAVAALLFQKQGYAATSVDMIVREAGVAKGTFYYYFKSKTEVLDALVNELVNKMAVHAEATAQQEQINAIDKLCRIIVSQNNLQEKAEDLVIGLHLPENRELHDKVNIETVKVFGPILAQVIEQGNREGVFRVDDPLSTIQFILAGSQFLFGYGIFNWTPEEMFARMLAMQTLVERALGAEPNALAALFNQLNHV